jgi:transcription antitermination factor NusG
MNTRWFALAVDVRSERSAVDGLHGVVEEVFLPSRIERRAWSDRIKSVEVPLFPGYCFIRVDLNPTARVAILKVKHVVDVVGRRAGREGLAPSVPDTEINSLRLLVAAGRSLDPLAALVAGVPVVVGAGPLRGVRGVVECAVDGQRRLVVNVALLGRAVRTTLLADDVLEAPRESG